MNLDTIKEKLLEASNVFEEFQYISTPEGFKQWLELYPCKVNNYDLDGQVHEWNIGPLLIQSSYTKPGLYRIYMNNSKIGEILA